MPTAKAYRRITRKPRNGCVRRRTLANRGPHGLPRAGFADWDDTLNVDHGSGRAESVWTAMLFCRTVLDLAEVCGHTSRPAEAARLADLHAAMARIVNAVAWDGDWYARAFDDAGLPIGVTGEERHVALAGVHEDLLTGALLTGALWWLVAAACFGVLMVKAAGNELFAVRSATSMNETGLSRPTPGRSQRTNASTPAQWSTAPSMHRSPCRPTTGW